MSAKRIGSVLCCVGRSHHQIASGHRQYEANTMKATIYALIDPNTHQVRYIGQTRTTIARRMKVHRYRAKTSRSTPVSEWIASLLPLEPVPVILRSDVEYVVTGPRQWNAALQAESNWMKRFARSPLLCRVPINDEMYTTLVNLPSDGNKKGCASYPSQRKVLKAKGK